MKAECAVLLHVSLVANANTRGSRAGQSKERLGGAAACAVKRTNLDKRIAWKARDVGAELKEGFEVGKENPTFNKQSGLWTVKSTGVRANPMLTHPRGPFISRQSVFPGVSRSPCMCWVDMSVGNTGEDSEGAGVGHCGRRDLEAGHADGLLHRAAQGRLQPSLH